MKSKINILAKIFILSSLARFSFIFVSGNPIYKVMNSEQYNVSQNSNLKEQSDDRKLNNMSDCELEEFDIQDVVFLNNTDIFLKSTNISVHSSHYHRNGDKIYVCQNTHENRIINELIANCSVKFSYFSDEYEILPNRSALLYGDIIEPDKYALHGGNLLICAVVDYSDDEKPAGDSTDSTLAQKFIDVGKIGSAISIVALIIHLLTFCFVPSLRNLPGYNLASLSVAFLLGYSFVLIGQIPEVLGLFCIMSGVLQQDFFLVAFFAMNVLAFDVWRTLKLATEKFIVSSSYVRKRQFMWYSLYAWGCPLVISTISVIIDQVDGVPNAIKPEFGENDTCWITNPLAKNIFFVAPAFTLFVINAIFFILSSMIISSNTMKCTNDHQRQNAKLNYILYVRLGLMMGLTWLLGIIARISQNDIMWFIHDIFNSLQGLFLFLLFTCTNKVMKHLKGKTSLKIFSHTTSSKQSTCTSKLDSH